MHKVVDLDEYRHARAEREKASIDHAVPCFSWEGDERLHQLAQSAFICQLTTKALEELDVNPVTPQYATRGKRIYLTIDERAMRKEGLNINDVFRGIRDTIMRRTAHTPEQIIIYPRVPGEQLQVSLYLP